MTNYLQTYLNIQETTLCRSFLTVFFEPQTLEIDHHFFFSKSGQTLHEDLAKYLQGVRKRYSACWKDFCLNFVRSENVLMPHPLAHTPGTQMAQKLIFDFLAIFLKNFQKSKNFKML